MAEHHDAKEKGYESFGMRIGPVILGTSGIVAVAALAFVLMWVMFLGLEKLSTSMIEPPPPMAAQQKPYDGLLLQANPPDELAEVTAESKAVLGSYGWVDKDAGVVHLPIEKAKALVLDRGLPVRK